MDENDDTRTLEDMIDKRGLTYVLAGLELVCHEKAEHVLSNYQDRALARLWERNARRCYAAAQKVEEA